MSKANKLIISCKEATMMAVRQEELKLGLFARFRLFLHLLSCKFCKRFIRQNKQVSTGLKAYQQKLSEHPLHHLSESGKEQLQEKINGLLGE